MKDERGNNKCWLAQGWGQFNANQPSHLLFWEGRMEGWGFVALKNQMIWDNTASICSYRSVRTGVGQ